MHRRFYAARLAALVVLLLCSKTVFSRPDMTPLGPNIADKGSAFYHFAVNTFDSTDGKRHYKVWTAIPKKSPPAAGYPVLYLLDGNAVMDKLSEPLLQKLSERDPPVLVAVGYQTDLPFDLTARAYDYTPAAEGEPQNLRGRQGGGSALFRQLLETTIAPQAEKGVAVNPQKRALWGHSYGGLLVLESYLSSTFFSAYYSAVPSLERNNFTLLKAMDRLPKASFSHKSLWFLEGDGDRKANDENATSGVLSAIQHRVSRLRADDLPVTYLLYPGLTHGAMFDASMKATILHMSGEALPASH
ncbi:Salmochelin siderophore protein IroE [Kosakonia radicincitans]|uniref:alpha/beta hydrolase n=1 Tax=Kosakonia radicincitans TaxID=283686 RepID=UPI0009035EEA|nr:alpha/beta hydrolase-fold protein [Kosakonia radicincitans]APG17373.1 Salmochelin siderophore protein IroE [Kosakonia radicincitans]MDD7996329.1 alpha/beta hydrolase-fold protein [Kosakonia radicincitans]